MFHFSPVCDVIRNFNIDCSIICGIFLLGFSWQLPNNHDTQHICMFFFNSYLFVIECLFKFLPFLKYGSLVILWLNFEISSYILDKYPTRHMPCKHFLHICVSCSIIFSQCVWTAYSHVSEVQLENLLLLWNMNLMLHLRTLSNFKTKIFSPTF